MGSSEFALKVVGDPGEVEEVPALRLHVNNTQGS
jgi:hypothetical protein